MKSTKAEKVGGLFELDPALSPIHRGLSVVCGQRTAMVLKKKNSIPYLHPTKLLFWEHKFQIVLPKRS